MLAQSLGDAPQLQPEPGQPHRRRDPRHREGAPAILLFLTVLCLALIGDGLRWALDPRSRALIVFILRRLLSGLLLVPRCSRF